MKYFRTTNGKIATTRTSRTIKLIPKRFKLLDIIMVGSRSRIRVDEKAELDHPHTKKHLMDLAREVYRISIEGRENYWFTVADSYGEMTAFTLYSISKAGLLTPVFLGVALECQGQGIGKILASRLQDADYIEQETGIRPVSFEIQVPMSAAGFELFQGLQFKGLRFTQNGEIIPGSTIKYSKHLRKVLGEQNVPLIVPPNEVLSVGFASKY